MNARWGWALATVAVALATAQGGWRGALLMGSVVVFWLLWQFNRSLRVLRGAAQAPMGLVPNAVMLHAKLRPGLTLLQILPLTGSMGLKLDGPAERFRWQDAGGDGVELTLANGRLTHWQLTRENTAEAELDAAAP